MLNLIADGVQAYEQVGMMLGALTCLALGGLLLGYSVRRRMHAIQVAGTIIGVTSSGGMFHPVYRYTMPDDQTYEAKSEMNSSWVRGKETGRIVPLMVSPDNPAEAWEAHSHVLDIVGLVLVLPAILLGYVALTAYPVTPMTWVMAAGLAIFVLARGHRLLIPKGQRLSFAEWRKKIDQRKAQPVDLADVKPIEEILSAPGARQTQVRNLKFATAIVAVFSVVCVCVTIHQSMRIARLETAGLRAPGEVVRLQQEYSSSDHGGRYVYYPVVAYRAGTNLIVEFKDSVGSNPPIYRRGDKVTVLYLPDNPQHEAIIDRGFWGNWLISATLFVASAFLIMLLIVMLRGRTAQTPPSAAAFTDLRRQAPT